MFGSFIIAFPEHVSTTKREYCIFQLRNLEVAIDAIGEDVFEVKCENPKQLALAGWSLFHTALRNYCRVVSVSGAASLKAGSYSRPNYRK